MVSKKLSSVPCATESISRKLNEPVMTVGIIDNQSEIAGRMNGNFSLDGFGHISGTFSAKALSDNIALINDENREVACASVVKLSGGKDTTFTLFQVTIGKTFHWERKEHQTFSGNLILMLRSNGTMAAINEIPLEDYLESVVSSEMSSDAPTEFLKAHAIISRSWLVSALKRKREGRPTGAGHISPAYTVKGAIPKESQLSTLKSQIPFKDEPVEEAAALQEEEKSPAIVTRWYEQEDHDLYDVCADDHCQRYQGITKIGSVNAKASVLETRGMAITFQGEVCDARYSKACGGITEVFETAWSDNPIPYLTCISDAAIPHRTVITEEDAAEWIFSEPDAYCNTKDPDILKKILPDFDRETKSFFRWKIKYERKELEDILFEKSGIDFGTLKEIKPLSRGPSGRIDRLSITGSKKSLVVGKELEIRRWLSRSHLYSSAFIVTKEYDTQGEARTFTFHGAGWGHGVGLCQIGAAVMATKGFSAEAILGHYFPGTELQRIY